MKFKSLGVHLLLCAVALPCGSAGATTLYTTSFEQPTFTTGPVNGQDGWSQFASSGTPSINVESTKAATGSQALEIDPASGVQAGPYKQVSTSATNIMQSAAIYIASGTTQSEWQFAAFDAAFQFAGGIRINPDGSIDEISNGFAAIGNFTFDQWNTVDINLDFATQTYSIDLNGTALATDIAMCGDNTDCTSGNVLPEYAYGSFLFCDDGSLCVNGTRDADDVGYLDDYTVASTPLPAALPLFGSGLGVLGLLGWTKKKKASRARANA